MIRCVHWGLGLIVLSGCGARSAVDEIDVWSEASASGGRSPVVTNQGGAAASGASGGAAASGASGGAAASGASGGAPAILDTCFPFPFTVIDDIEDGRIEKMIAAGVSLTWWTSSAPRTAARLSPVKLSPPRAASRTAMLATTGGPALSLGFQLSPCAHIGYPRAIAFWARASTSTRAEARIASQANTPSSAGGWCSTTPCVPASKWLELTGQWQRFELPFTEFEPQPSPATLEAFRSLELAIDIEPKSGPVELWMDDPEFLR